MRKNDNTDPARISRRCRAGASHYVHDELVAALPMR